jgi:hypothetical protein
VKTRGSFLRDGGDLDRAKACIAEPKADRLANFSFSGDPFEEKPPEALVNCSSLGGILGAARRGTYQMQCMV